MITNQNSVDDFPDGKDENEEINPPHEPAPADDAAHAERLGEAD